MTKQSVGLLGANSLVGMSLVSLLVESGWNVVAFAREMPPSDSVIGVDWRLISNFSDSIVEVSKEGDSIPYWICLAPIWIFPKYFSLLERYQAKRVIAFSSTSRYTKSDSPDVSEKRSAQRQAAAEIMIKLWAESKAVDWTILRPTLIYGYGRDKNITEIASFIKRFGFFPVFGDAVGLRQPVHVDDVANACVFVLQSEKSFNRTYEISGGEVLTYREMVERVFKAQGKPIRIIRFPLLFFKLCVAFVNLIKNNKNFTVAMAERMNKDMAFEHADATRDLRFLPRAFLLTKQDVLK